MGDKSGGVARALCSETYRQARAANSTLRGAIIELRPYDFPGRTANPMTWNMSLLLVLMVAICALCMLVFGKIIWELHAQRRREAVLASMRRENQVMRER